MGNKNKEARENAMAARNVCVEIFFLHDSLASFTCIAMSIFYSDSIVTSMQRLAARIFCAIFCTSSAFMFSTIWQ